MEWIIEGRGCEDPFEPESHSHPGAGQPHPHYMAGVWRQGFSVLEMGGRGADARVPKINVHYISYGEVIQNNTKHVKLAFKYFYSPAPSLAAVVHMS